MDKNKKKPKNIEFSILEIRKLSYFENDFSEFGLKSLNRKKISFKFGIHVGIRAQTELISFTIKTTAIYPKDKKENELFGVGTLFSYKIKNFEGLFQKNIKNEYSIPDELMIMLFGMSLSGVRGMLIGSNTKPEYLKIILPPINTKELLFDYHKSIKSSKDDPVLAKK